MFNWFSNKKQSVADLESIDATPVITIPEKTRRELYDLAVAEVQERRVAELILRGLKDLAADQEIVSQTAAAKLEYPHDILLSDVGDLTTKYPLVQLKGYTDMDGDTTYSVRSIEPTLESLSIQLTKQYLSE